LELEGAGIASDKNGTLKDNTAAWFFAGGFLNWSAATITDEVLAPGIAEGRPGGVEIPSPRDCLEVLTS
jgi:hypothetical protein